MNIGNAITNYGQNYASKTSGTEKALNAYKENSKNASSRSTDTVEISKDGYELQSKSENMSAATGKYPLRITQGKNPDSYVIHFENMALAHRVVRLGYFTVNGQDIPLSDEVKEKILKTTQEAFEANERAIYQYAMEHNAIVAKQQAEALGNESERMSRAVSVMSQMASGGKVSEADRKFLAEYSPEMYAMAISAEMMADQQEKQKEKQLAEISEESKEQAPTQDYAKEIGELKREYTDTTLEISFHDAGITVGEVGTSTYEF